MAVSRVDKEKKLITWGRLTWINMEKPTAEDMEYLAQNYPFDPLELEDCRSRIELPKIDEPRDKDYLFIVVHFPVFSKKARVSTRSQVSVFIGENYLITVHSGDLKPLVKLYAECQADEEARKEYMGRSSGYLLYRILDRLVDYCFPILRKVVGNIERAEESVFSQAARETVREISIVRRDVIAFRRIIHPQLPVIESLEKRERPFLKEELEEEFGDIADHIHRISDELDDCKEVIEGLNDTNNSLTSNRINQVIRVLTIISTIMLPLSVISGIYGMNIPLPFERSPFSFIAVLVVMLCIITSMLALFRLKRWI